MDRTLLAESGDFHPALEYLCAAYHECTKALNDPRAIIIAALADLAGEEHDSLDKLSEFRDDLEFMEEWLEDHREAYSLETMIGAEGKVLALGRLLKTGKRCVDNREESYDCTRVEKRVAEILRPKEEDPPKKKRDMQIYHLENEAWRLDTTPYQYDDYLKDMGLILAVRNRVWE